MFQTTTFALHSDPKHSSRYFTLTLLIGLLLLLFLGGCKSASTPTQPQSQAQPQSQPVEPSTPQADQQNPNTTTSNTQGGSSTSSGARSNEEIIGDFDAELDASIAVFDGMILEERAKAEAIEASLGGGDGGGGAGGGEGDLFEDGDIYEGVPGYGEFPDDAEGSEGEYQQTGSESTASADGSDSENGTASEGGADSPSGPETTRRGGIPEDIEGGSDDDIVARQIREAALKEKDPALREKLWDEYRKYKNQQ